jgi:CheY-like chemotaxis protein
VLPRYSPRYSPRSLRIIVADDEPDSVTALKLLLNDEGHDVVPLSKGAEVLRTIEEFKPDAVVLDIAMPDLSGYEIAKEIRKRYGQIMPLLIAVTGRRLPTRCSAGSSASTTTC